jgi:hypothetical protein
MLIDSGQHSVLHIRDWTGTILHGAQGTSAETHLPLFWQAVKNIAKNSAKAIPLLSGRNA